MKPFMKIDKLGELRIDVVLFESYYPILFTCLNENNDLFLCVCCQSNKEGRKWLITKTTPNIVVKVLKNQLTVREAFLMFPQIQFTIFDDAQKVLINEKNELDWDEEKSISLPDKGEFLDAEEGEFDDEILYYESLNCNNYHTIFNEIKINLSNKQIQMGKNFIEKLDISNVYYKEIDLCLKSSEIYNEVKKEMQKIIFNQCKNICLSYNGKYEEMKKRVSKESLAFGEYTRVEDCIKEIPEAA